jgi:hypothetical protein
MDGLDTVDSGRAACESLSLRSGIDSTREILAAKKGVLAEAMADTLPKTIQEAVAGALTSYCSSAIKVGASTAPPLPLHAVIELVFTRSRC